MTILPEPRLLKMEIRNYVIAPIMKWPVLDVRYCGDQRLQFYLDNQTPQCSSNRWYTRQLIQEHVYKVIVLEYRGRSTSIATYHPREKLLRILGVNPGGGAWKDSAFDFIKKMLLNCFDAHVPNTTITEIDRLTHYSIDHLIKGASKSAPATEVLGTFNELFNMPKNVDNFEADDEADSLDLPDSPMVYGYNRDDVISMQRVPGVQNRRTTPVASYEPLTLTRNQEELMTTMRREREEERARARTEQAVEGSALARLRRRITG